MTINEKKKRKKKTKKNCQSKLLKFDRKIIVCTDYNGEKNPSEGESIE